jgi:hypothetical protein
MVSVTAEGAPKPEPEHNEVDQGRPAEEATPVEDDVRATVRPTRRLLRQRLEQWWQQFKSEVIGEHASLGPFGGWLILALLGVIAYLTLSYAEGAIQRGQMAHGADPSGLISVQTGYWTLLIVALLALFVGFEPQIASPIRRWFARRPRNVRGVLTGFGSTMLVLWRLPSVICNVLDYMLARVIAPLAGTTQQSALLRYAWGAAVVLVIPVAGLFAPPPFGLFLELDRGGPGKVPVRGSDLARRASGRSQWRFQPGPAR